MASKRQGKLIGRMLPAAVWLSATAAVVFLYLHRHQTFALTGLAVASSQTLSAADNGIVRVIPVSLFEPVQRGDLLAIVELGSPPENEYLKAVNEARKNTMLAELDRLKAELAAVEQQLRFDIAAEHNSLMLRYGQLALDVENLYLDLLQIRTDLEMDRGLLAGLELEKNAVHDLLDKQAIHPYEARKAELEYEAMARKVAATEQLEAEAQNRLNAARRQLEQYALGQVDQSYIDALLGPHRKAVTVQENMLAELFAPTFRMMLTAKIDGVVSSILTSEGQGVQAGDIILTVSPPSADYILAWLDPAFQRPLEIHQPVEVAKHTFPRQVFQSEISSISPTVELLPEQLWPTPTMPKWGRAIKISIPEGIQLAGNELVGIRGL